MVSLMMLQISCCWRTLPLISTSLAFWTWKWEPSSMAMMLPPTNAGARWQNVPPARQPGWAWGCVACRWDVISFMIIEFQFQRFSLLNRLKTDKNFVINVFYILYFSNTIYRNFWKLKKICILDNWALIKHWAILNVINITLAMSWKINY